MGLVVSRVASVATMGPHQAGPRPLHVVVIHAMQCNANDVCENILVPLYH